MSPATAWEPFKHFNHLQWEIKKEWAVKWLHVNCYMTIWWIKCVFEWCVQYLCNLRGVCKKSFKSNKKIAVIVLYFMQFIDSNHSVRALVDLIFWKRKKTLLGQSVCVRIPACSVVSLLSPLLSLKPMQKYMHVRSNSLWVQLYFIST